MNSCGVYSVVCNANGKTYYGSSNHPNKRIKQHIYALRSGKHQNKEMLADFISFGEASFCFSILEEGEFSNMGDAICRERELYESSNKANLYNKMLPMYNSRCQELHDNPRLSIRLNKDVKEWIERSAKEALISPGDIINKIIRQKMKKKK